MNTWKPRMTQDLELAGFAERTRLIYLPRRDGLSHAVTDFATFGG